MLSLFNRNPKPVTPEKKPEPFTIKKLLESSRALEKKQAGEVAASTPRFSKSPYANFIEKLKCLVSGNWELRETDSETYIYHSGDGLNLEDMLTLKSAGINIELRNAETKDGRKIIAYIISQFDPERFDVYANTKIVKQSQKLRSMGLLEDKAYFENLASLLKLPEEECRSLTDKDLRVQASGVSVRRVF